MHVEDFRRDGAVVVRDAVAPRWLDELAAGVEHNRRHPSPWAHWYTDPGDATGFWSDYVTWPTVAPYRRVVFESGLADLARELMGSRQVRSKGSRQACGAMSWWMDFGPHEPGS